MYTQIQCYNNTLKKIERKVEREREIPEEDDEKVFLVLWRNWSEAEQTFFSLTDTDTDTDTVAEAEAVAEAIP